MKNPYSINFGMLPRNLIERTLDTEEVIENFSADDPGCKLYMISGIRGSGKTVTMTEIENYFKKDKNWIVIDLNPELDLLESLTAELSNHPSTVQLLKDAKINLSLLGLGIEIDGIPPVTSISAALDQILERISKQGKRILITIDEVTNNKNVRVFSSQFQIFLRKNYPVFMIMTGLYENIYNLQNEKTLTFLYRAPKIKMKPLNLRRISMNYQKVFGISEEEAYEMAKLTKGYPYAFQLLGYVCARSGRKYTEMIDEFDLYMSEYVYDKIWSELTPTDRKTILAICQSPDGKASHIRQQSGQTSNQYNKYRSRLIDKELIQTSDYGYVEFTLPRFREYVLAKR